MSSKIVPKKRENFMSFCFNLLVVIMLVISGSSFAISQIESLSQISINQPAKTFFLFDIDDTIFDSPTMLGSKAWRKYIVEAAGRNWHDIFSYALAQKYPIKTVEEITSSFVRNLQNKGFVVCALTSRERKLWYDMPQEGIDVLTENQLSSVGVNFNNRSLENIYPQLSEDSEYYNGIFFAHIEPKGNYLYQLLEKSIDRPEKIIFIDDKLSQVESVAAALTKLGLPHECYLYAATDKKAFRPLVANIQLYYFYESDGQRIISDEEASVIIENNPEKDADYYLNAALNHYLIVTGTCK